MQDNVSVLVATIIAVIIIVLFPIYNVATRNDSVAKNIVVEATTNFVDSARTKGYISQELYDEFVNKIHLTGNVYEVEMEVYNPILIETEESTEEDPQYEEHYEIDYTSAILEKMQDSVKEERASLSVITNNVYHLDEGDKFYVRVKNTNITQAQILMDRLFGGDLNKERIVVNYGGVVFAEEWKKGETTQTLASNLTISRPIDRNDKECKYGHIAATYDEITGKVVNLYAIAVVLSDDNFKEGAENIIKFKVTYTDVVFKNGDTDLTQSQREDVIENNFKTTGFQANITNVEEIVTDNINGIYQYMVTLSNISYSFEEMAYVRAKVYIEDSTAQTKLGTTLGMVTSEEFIITYGVIRPVITIASSNPSTAVNAPHMVEPDTNGKRKINFTFKVEAPVSIEKIFIEIENNGRIQKKEVICSETDVGEFLKTFEHEFDGGLCSMKVYVKDARGVESEVVETEFMIARSSYKYTLSSGNNTITTSETPGYYINTVRADVFFKTLYSPHKRGWNCGYVSYKISGRLEDGIWEELVADNNLVGCIALNGHYANYNLTTEWRLDMYWPFITIPSDKKYTMVKIEFSGPVNNSADPGTNCIEVQLSYRK